VAPVTAWLAVLAIGAGTIVLKAAGPLLVAVRNLPRRTLGVVELLAPALLAALVVTQGFTDEDRVVLDARAAGVAAGVVAAALRLPLALVVVLAAAATAGARAL
jgi:branched-subunit amino acid transport protein